METININTWSSGISDSITKDFVDMRCVDTRNNTLKIGKSPSDKNSTYYTGTFILDGGVELASGTLAYGDYTGTGRAVTFTSTGTLPTGLSEDTIYFVRAATNGSNEDIYKVYPTYDDAEDDTNEIILTGGSGTHTITSVDMGEVTQYCYDDSNHIYAIDRNSHVWYIGPIGGVPKLIAGNLLVGEGTGIAFWKKHLFAFRGAKLDVYNPTTKTWTNDWQTLNSSSYSGNSHFALAAGNTKLYACDAQYLFSLSENSGKVFDPSDNTTYTANTKALSIPSNERTTCLGELGNKLWIGTNSNRIYPWDMITTSHNLPFTLSEKGVTSMLTINNRMYITHGKSACLSVTNGTQIEEILNVRDRMGKHTTINYDFVIGGSCYFDNEILFSVSVPLRGLGVSGIYAYNLDTGGLILKNVVSQNTYGTDPNIQLYSMISSESGYMYSYMKEGDTNIYYNDVVTTSLYASSEAYVETGFYFIGENTNQGTPEEINVYLSKNLASTQSIKLEYRYNLTDSYTTLTTINTSTYGVADAYTIPASQITSDKVQFKITLDGTTSLTPEIILITSK